MRWYSLTKIQSSTIKKTLGLINFHIGSVIKAKKVINVWNVANVEK